MKILLYGGSFDPPHIGHVELLKNAVDKIKPDLTLVVPAFFSPLRQESGADRRHRYWMTKLAFAEMPVQVSTMDIDRGRRTYTFELLRAIKEVNPGAELFTLLGEDVYRSLEDFRNEEEVRANSTIVTGKRGGFIPDVVYEVDPDKATIWVQAEGTKISSSDVRRRAANGWDLRGAIHPLVHEYIDTWRLYREETQRGKESV